MMLRRISTISFLVVLSVLPLMADKEDKNLLSANSLIPDVPQFTITYQGEALVCSPTGLIKTKTHKDLVTYECQKVYTDVMSQKIQDVEPGVSETKRLRKDVQNKIAQGTKYSVEIPLYDADRPTKARIMAERQLNNRPYGKYLRMLLPAKLYLSIRPQLANSGEDGDLDTNNYIYFGIENIPSLIYWLNR